MSFQKQVLLYRDGDAEPTPAATSVDEKLTALFGNGYRGADVVDDDPEPPAPTPPANPEPPAPAATEPPANPSNPEPPTPPAPAAAEPAKPEGVSYKDWKEALKAGADKYEVLKELGYDDFVIDMLKYKDTVGDLTPYLEVKTVDYTKMSPEELLMLDLKKSNPGMIEAALRFKFNKEFSEKYYTDRDLYPESSDEATYGAEQLRLDAENKRKQFIEEQGKFKAPEPKPDTSQTEREAALQQQREQISTGIMNDPATKAVIEGKVITFGEGEESFKHPIQDAQALIDAAASFALSQNMKEFTGAPLQKFFKSIAMAQDPDGFEANYAKHIHAVAHKKFQSELQNVSQPPPPGAEANDQKDPFNGGYKTGRR